MLCNRVNVINETVMQHIFIHDDHLKNLNHKKHILMIFLGVNQRFDSCTGYKKKEKCYLCFQRPSHYRQYAFE